MDFQEVVSRRRMVRSFDPARPVPAETRDRILANAVRAPSAGFAQGWAFLVLEDPLDRERFWAATFEPAVRERFHWPGLFAAPLLIVPMSCKAAYLDRYAEADKGVFDRSEDFWPVPYWDVDTGMAAMLMLLTVVDEELGALFFGIFGASLPSFRAAFSVPEAYSPVGVIAVGYPDGNDRPSKSLARGRRAMNEVVHRGRFHV